MRIGVDVGTTATKAVLLTPTGEVLTSRSAATPLRNPAPGRYEYDVGEFTDRVFDLVRELATPDIDLIALTGQGDGLWLIDEHARGVRPAVAWLDARGAAVCDEWAKHGVVVDVFARTRNAPFPGAGAALLASLMRIEQTAIAAARTATQCQLVLFEVLTKVRAATRSCAMLPVFDPEVGNYDDDAVRLTGLARVRHLLPDIAPEPTVVAPMVDAAAADLGLRRGVRVATGPYDLPAAALGAGSLSVGDGLLTLGTTLACQVLVGDLKSDIEPVGLTLCTADGNGWLRAMPAMLGTACIDWALRLVGADQSSLRSMLASSPLGANGVSALPYLSPSGERAPFSDSAARGVLSGLTFETTAADIVRAMCEALAHAARHCFDAAGLSGNVVVCGGGSISPELLQLFADVLERPLIVAVEDAAARGAVAAAAAATGSTARPAPPRKMVHPRRQYDYARDHAVYLERLGVARGSLWRRGSPASG
jgi:sugar (pentulose or hexulose) kinase